MHVHVHDSTIHMSACLQCVGVSAVTGEGTEEFFQKVAEAADEYER